MQEKLEVVVEKGRWSEVDRQLNFYLLQGWTLFDLRQTREADFHIIFKRKVEQQDSQLSSRLSTDLRGLQ